MSDPDPGQLDLANNQPLRHLARLARQRGQDVWLCGGVLRDALLGVASPDLDLAVAGDALTLGQALAQAAGGRFVLLDRQRATCRVVFAGRAIDLAGLRAADIAGDLAARDFTINAMAVELTAALAGTGRLIDPTGGQSDLAAKLLRPAGPGVLLGDPLRVLRGCRFVATHGLEPAPGVDQLLREAAPGLANVAAERVGHEWLAMLAGERPAQGARLLDQVGALTLLVPALEQGRGLDQNPFHHLDVLEHNLACLDAAQAIWRDPAALLAGQAAEVAAYLAPERRRALFMTAALLHDIGKPAVRQPGEPGWASFHRHDAVGARLARQACLALGLAKADSLWVSRMVALHMRPFHLLGAQERKQLSPRGVRRIVQAAGDDLPGLFALAMADTVAGRGPLRPPEAEKRLARLHGRVARLRDNQLAAALAAPPLLGGHQLMAALGIGPGPKVGRLLALIREAQLDGALGSAYDAVALARRHLDEG